MSTFNFHGDISGPSNFGDNGRIEIHQPQDPAEALRLTAELVQWIRAEQPALAAQADLVQEELAAANQQGRPADRSRIRRALETLSLGLTVGSSGWELGQKLGHVLGV